MASRSLQLISNIGRGSWRMASKRLEPRLSSQSVKIPPRGSTTSISKLHSLSSSTCSSGLECSTPAVSCLHRSTPWLMLLPEVDEATGEKFDLFYSVAERQVVRINRREGLKVPDEASCFASARGWLGFINPKDCSLYLTSPFHSKVLQLPSIASLPSILGVERDPVSGAICQFRIVDVSAGGSVIDTGFTVEPHELFDVMKYVALSSPNPFNEDCLALAIQGEVPRLAFCRTKEGAKEKKGGIAEDDEEEEEEQWSGLQEDYHPGPGFFTAAYSEKDRLFYTLFSYVGLQAYDLHNPRKRSRVVLKLDFDILCTKYMEAISDGPSKLGAVKFYLVVSHNNDLLLVAKRTWNSDGHHHWASTIDKGEELVKEEEIEEDEDEEEEEEGEEEEEEEEEEEDIRYNCKTFHFDVFKLDIGLRRLERTMDLEGHSIFIGMNQSFYLSADDFPGLHPDSIYFADDWFPGCEHRFCGHDSGIFDLRESRIHPPCYSFGDNKEKLPSPLFWVDPCE